MGSAESKQFARKPATERSRKNGDEETAFFPFFPILYASTFLGVFCFLLFFSAAARFKLVSGGRSDRPPPGVQNALAPTVRDKRTAIRNGADRRVFQEDSAATGSKEKGSKEHEGEAALTERQDEEKVGHRALSLNFFFSLLIRKKKAHEH